VRICDIYLGHLGRKEGRKEGREGKGKEIDG
jgi:hypothetical protein